MQVLLRYVKQFGNFFCSIGKKTYFLALGTTPVKGVGFIAGKITDVISSTGINLFKNNLDRYYRRRHGATEASA